MFWLWDAKKKTARALDSAALLQDAACSFACIKLSLVLLAGSLLYLAAPSLWWADPVAGLVLAALIGKEGLDAVKASRRPDFTGGCGCDCPR
jgi:divalent metal cation (Fe/Co/Zn/Cd) transporter